MSKRYGRNKKRAHLEHIRVLRETLRLESEFSDRRHKRMRENLHEIVSELGTWKPLVRIERATKAPEHLHIHCRVPWPTLKGAVDPVALAQTIADKVATDLLMAIANPPPPAEPQKASE